MALVGILWSMWRERDLVLQLDGKKCRMYRFAIQMGKIG